MMPANPACLTTDLGHDTDCWPGRRAAFTLVEMVVVIGIVVVLVALALPAVNTMWEERKLAAAQSTVQGMLMTARSRAISASGLESGLFFLVDRRGTQYIVPIGQDPQHSGDVAWENVFQVTDDRTYTLPAPIRVVPRYVVAQSGLDVEIFSTEELINNDFSNPPEEANQAQRHRNFFTMVFSSEGQLLVRRDVVIQDPDEDEDGLGDKTRLEVGPDPEADTDERAVNAYYAQDDTQVPMRPDALGIATEIAFLVRNPQQEQVAINFPSVDGLLVYDDSLYNGLSGTGEQRNYLLEAAQPFYVNRFTGAIVRGPLGEN